MLIKVLLFLFGSPMGSFAFHHQLKPWQEVHGGSRKTVMTTTTRRQTHVKLRQRARKPSPTSHVYFPHTFLFISATRLKGLLTDKTEKSSSPSLSVAHVAQTFPCEISFVTKEWKNFRMNEDGRLCFPYTRNLQIGFSHFPHRNLALT